MSVHDREFFWNRKTENQYNALNELERSVKQIITNNELSTNVRSSLDGDSWFIIATQLIKSAKHEVHLNTQGIKFHYTYIEFFNAITDAKCRGAEVHIYVDNEEDIGKVTTADLKLMGVKIHKNAKQPMRGEVPFNFLTVDDEKFWMSDCEPGKHFRGKWATRGRKIVEKLNNLNGIKEMNNGQCKRATIPSVS